MAIKTAEELWQDYFMEQENNEFLSTFALVQWKNTIEKMEKAANDKAFEEWEEEIAFPFIEAEEEAEAKDFAKKAKHRKSRKAERDEYHHHRKPYWKYRDLNNEFALNRKREKRNLKVNNLLSKYETEKIIEEEWAEKKQEETDLYTNGEDIVDYVWETVIHENGLGDLWNFISENGHFSYSCPEDFGNKFFEVEEEEEETEKAKDLFEGLEYPPFDCNSYEEELPEQKHNWEDDDDTEESTYEMGFEAGKQYVVDLLKAHGITVDLSVLDAVK